MKTLRNVGLVLVASILAGCTPGVETMTYEVLPDDLKDCKFYLLKNSSGDRMRVVRCPNSVTTTTYTSGKSTITTVVIDGVEYIQKK
jgi:hypothetical protein